MLTLKRKDLITCPLCNAKNRRELWCFDDTKVFKCQHCGLSYIDPCLDSQSMAMAYESSESLKNLNEFHDGYYEYGDLETGTKTLRDFSKSLDLIEKNLELSSRSIYEVGFGNGLLLALAQKRGWAVGGIDTSRRNVELACKKFSLGLENGFFEDIEGRPGAYDAIAMMDVIEHQDNPHCVLEKAYSVLRPGGLLLLATPNEGSLLKWLAFFLYRVSGGRFTGGLKKIYFLEHVTYYNKKTLTALLRKNRFEPVEWYLTSTDLAKFKLRPMERLLAESILFAGEILGLQNRIHVIARKTA